MPAQAHSPHLMVHAACGDRPFAQDHQQSQPLQSTLSQHQPIGSQLSLVEVNAAAPVRTEAHLWLQEINQQVAAANGRAGKVQPGSEAAQRSQLLGEPDGAAAASSQAPRRRGWQVGEHLEGMAGSRVRGLGAFSERS